jgi:type IV secretion system protein VirB3
MSARNPGLLADPLFVGATRPPMRWGVTYTALLANLVFTLEVFLLSRNLLTLLICIPIHATCALLCARDARCFDLFALWLRLRLAALFSNLRLWGAASYCPLRLPRRNRNSSTRRPLPMPHL